MWSLLAAAALIAQPAAPKITDDADFRCLAVVSVVIGQAPKQSVEDFTKVAGLTAVMMYYLGRIDLRYPDLDMVAAFKSLDDNSSFSSQFTTEAARCGDEAQQRGRSLQEMGRALQKLPPRVRGKLG